MTGIWLMSYILLWGVVALMALLLVGMLRQLGVLSLRLAGPSPTDHDAPTAERAGAVPPLDQAGPRLGSRLPEWAREVAAWGDARGDAREDKRDADAADRHADRQAGFTLLMFLSPLCETCQHVVEPLNELAADTSSRVRPAAIIRADQLAYEAFLNVFPLRLPTLRDHDRTLTMGLGVHRAPFGLLYDRDGALVRKGLIEDREDLMALVGDEAITSAQISAKIVRQVEPALQ